METDTAPRQKQEVYVGLQEGNIDPLALRLRGEIQTYLVENIIRDYIAEIGKDLPEKLAFDYNDNEVLIWAEVKDDDEAFQRLLIRAEARVSSKYYKFGYSLESMIMEASDNYPIPPHYQVFK